MARSTEVRPNSWHYRVYKWWKDQSGFDRKKSYTFRENFCHYSRVVLFWAPMGRFFVVPIWREVRLWMIAAVLGMLYSLWFGLTYYPDLTRTVLIYLGIITVGVVLACGFLYLLERAEDSRLAKIVLLVLMSPLLVPVFLIYLVVTFLWTYVINPYYVTRHAYRREVWAATILAILGLLFLIGGIELYVVLGLVIGFTVAVSAAATLLVMFFTVFVPYLWNRFQDWRYARIYAWARTPDAEPGISGMDVVRNVVESKRGSVICPFITLPETDT